jgi:hypothetical protein
MLVKNSKIVIKWVVYRPKIWQKINLFVYDFLAMESPLPLAPPSEKVKSYMAKQTLVLGNL